MLDVFGKTVSIVGRLAAVSNRVAGAEVERRGGIVRRGLPQQTSIVVVGRRSLRPLADGRLEAKLARADQIGATALSENAFLRVLDLLPPAAGGGAVRLADLPGKTGLDAEHVRLLVLLDVVEPIRGECTFRDLVTAREIGRLLREGLSLAQVLDGARRLERYGADGDSLPRLKLACDEEGHLARRIGDALAELDGQMRLALPQGANRSVDELFEAAEEAEQSGDLQAAAALYRSCVSLDRHDPIAPFNLANVLREQGRTGEASLFLELALSIDPHFADAWYNLALIKEAAGDRRAAETCLTRALAADPTYADPLYTLARLQFDAGRYDRAGELWQRYLTLDPDSEWSRRARAGLTLCQQLARENTA